MNWIKKTISPLLIGLVLLGFAVPALAANIIIAPKHGNDGTGFYDPAPRAPIGGNPKTTLGAQRLFAAQYAANLLGSKLQSHVTIVVSATFRPLGCTQYSGELGHAGPTSAYVNFPGAPEAGVYYPTALANAIAGRDLNGSAAEIGAAFNSQLDSSGNNCLMGADWYYGIDGNNPRGSNDFLPTFTHELLHGLGFTTYTDLPTGALVAPGKPDIFTTLLLDLDQHKTWPAMTNYQRKVSATNTGRLVWDGASVTTFGAPTLTNGVAAGKVQLYAPATLDEGSSVSHWSQTVSPNALMEPYANADVDINRGIGLAACVLQDIGWTLTPATSCPDYSAPQAATLYATPQTASFPATVIGQTSTQTIRVSNTGDYPLTIQRITPPTAPFTIFNNTCRNAILQTGEQCRLDVRFSPQTTGSAADSLTIASNGGNTTVALHATGQLFAAPIIQANPTKVAFGGVELGQSNSKTVSLSNDGNATLAIRSISGLSAPFSITKNACSNTFLAPGRSCHLTITYTPNGLLTAQGSLTVTSNDRTLHISVSGNGTDSRHPVITASSATLPFGQVAVGSQSIQRLTITNTGADTLRISRIAGVQSPFSVQNDQCSGQDLAKGNHCDITLQYRPTTTGSATGSLTIYSNDTSQPSLHVTLRGNAASDTDQDGVPDSQENAGPNAGDANHDGIADALQRNVATLKDSQGRYVTLTTDSGSLTNVHAFAVPSGVLSASNAAFSQGFFGFHVIGLPVGGTAHVTLRLPAGAAPNRYYKFARQGDSGRIINVTQLVTFNGDHLTLTLTDGERGDADAIANGTIVDPGGPATYTAPTLQPDSQPTTSTTSNHTSASKSGGGGGAIPLWSLFALILLSGLRRRPNN